jgi:hypothetical protein
MPLGREQAREVPAPQIVLISEDTVKAHLEHRPHHPIEGYADHSTA